MDQNVSKAKTTPTQRFIRSDGVLYIILALGALAFEWVRPVPSFASGPLAVVVVNPWQSLIHLAFGIVWIYCAKSERMAQTACLLVGVACALLTVLGFLNLAGSLGISGPAAPDNFLHLCTAILAFYYATAGAADTSTPTLLEASEQHLPVWPQS